jgi:hypothetical protein
LKVEGGRLSALALLSVRLGPCVDLSCPSFFVDRLWAAACRGQLKTSLLPAVLLAVEAQAKGFVHSNGEPISDREAFYLALLRPTKVQTGQTGGPKKEQQHGGRTMTYEDETAAAEDEEENQRIFQPKFHWQEPALGEFDPRLNIDEQRRRGDEQDQEEEEERGSASILSKLGDRISEVRRRFRDHASMERLGARGTLAALIELGCEEPLALESLRGLEYPLNFAQFAALYLDAAEASAALDAGLLLPRPAHFDQHLAAATGRSDLDDVLGPRRPHFRQPRARQEWLEPQGLPKARGGLLVPEEESYGAAAQEAAIQRAFEAYDLNGDGIITYLELRTVSFDFQQYISPFLFSTYGDVSDLFRCLLGRGRR